MGGPEFTIAIVVCLLAFVFLGMDIAIALGMTSVLGISFLMGGIDPALSLLKNTAYESLRNYVFAVVPLFILLGELVARSGAASDLYSLVNRSMTRLPGRLALATVGGNAVFGAVTGVSIASAATFARIAYPQMVHHRYNKTVALGSVAGSAALGMLIPPSVLMIIWGVITEESIGRLFIAGIVPGILLAVMLGTFVIGFAVLRPNWFGASATDIENDSEALTVEQRSTRRRSETIGGIGILTLIVLVLGGIWFGWFTPTEAAGIGVLAALVLGVAKGMRAGDIWQAILDTGRTSAPILFLLITAQMYSRLLALGGIITIIQEALLGISFGDPAVILIFMVLVWFVMGMFIDSVSIILLTVPIFAPMATAIGYDAIAFAIIGIVAIEAGLLTPPFGTCIYAVKSCITDPEVRLSHIFIGAAPYWVILLLLVTIVAIFPRIATWLPSTML